MANWRIEITNRRTIIVHHNPGHPRTPEDMIAEAIKRCIPLEGTTELKITEAPDPYPGDEDDE